MKWKTAGIN